MLRPNHRAHESWRASLPHIWALTYTAPPEPIGWRGPLHPLRALIDDPDSLPARLWNSLYPYRVCLTQNGQTLASFDAYDWYEKGPLDTVWLHAPFEDEGRLAQDLLRLIHSRRS